MKIKWLYLIIVLSLVLTSACTTAQAEPLSAISTSPSKAADQPVSITVTAPAPSGLTAEACLTGATDNPGCKTCCDCLPVVDAEAIKSCRDACAEHDFSLNSGTLVVTAPSVLGAGGDYSVFTASGSQQECKLLCDSSTTLACGDRRFCRDACAGLGDTPPASSPPEEDAGAPAGLGDELPAPGHKGAAGAPPAEAIAACTGKAEQAACEFTWQKGTETGVCESLQNRLACSPSRVSMGGRQPGENGGQPGERQPDGEGPSYTIEQAISDKAQGMTIAFDALAFLTGDLGSDSFFPPGKVADFWGFQYLRDNDPSQMGHAGDFLTSAALNTLDILTPEQRLKLVALANSQVDGINQYAYDRFVLMQAFRRLLEGNLPAGTTGLDEAAVKEYSARLYQLDGQMSYERAQVMGDMLRSLDATQKAALDSMVGKGMREWSDVDEPEDIRALDRDVKVAVMTYAADMFSWYAGSVDADVYFCPERHGTYFGSFYLKDRPAMDDSTYAIPTNMTGDMGEALLAALTPDQAQKVTSLVEIQRPSLQEILETRRQVSNELRKFKVGEVADKAAVMALMEKYGELDGEIVYNLAAHFAAVSQSLTAEQKAQLVALRKQMLGDQIYPSGAYLYSQPISMPEIPNTDFLFK